MEEKKIVRALNLSIKDIDNGVLVQYERIVVDPATREPQDGSESKNVYCKDWAEAEEMAAEIIKVIAEADKPKLRGL